jgi:dihydrofolate reductase
MHARMSNPATWIGGFGGPEMGAFVQRVLDEPQVMIVGRKTYEVLAGFWRDAKAPQSKPMNALPKLVFSKTLREPLSWKTLVS